MASKSTAAPIAALFVIGLGAMLVLREAPMEGVPERNKDAELRNFANRKGVFTVFL